MELMGGIKTLGGTSDSLGPPALHLLREGFVPESPFSFVFGHLGDRGVDKILAPKKAAGQTLVFLLIRKEFSLS